MLHLVISFAVLGGAQCIEEGLPAAPVDVNVGVQTVELRKALVARTPGARLVLFARRAEGDPGATDGASPEAFRSAVPKGSISAVLRTADGHTLTLEHTGYSYYQGFKGLLLTDPTGDAGVTSRLYSSLELDSKVALRDVRVVWLDRAVVDVRDVHRKL